MKQNTDTPELFTWSPSIAPAYPTEPGWREPTTSREAAERIKPKAANLRSMVLDVIAQCPRLAVHQIAARLDLPVATVQPRISELKKLRKIQTSGERHKNASGASAHTWIAVQEGGNDA